ncbi:LysE family transporter [Neisseria sp. GT4A_CT1]|uniref:LysE family transporter n=1 Tax=Neisseria sp. GT4A_CT1 TaxID=665946 RepID=UPI0024B1581F|nr:LysE family transporter [Neisseria sp. GT4A_CT1]
MAAACICCISAIKVCTAKAAGGTVEIRKDHMADEPTRKTIWRGVLCNVLNPKAVVYMLSLFTVVLSPDTPMWQMGVYGVWMALMLFVWFSLVALMLSAPAVSKRFQRFGH